MRQLMLTLVVLVTLVTVASSQDTVTFEDMTVDGTAGGFVTTTIRPTGGPPQQSCSGQLETAAIRYRFDGTDPTSTVGTLVNIGSIITIHGAAYLRQASFIADTATSGQIQWHCTREP